MKSLQAYATLLEKIFLIGLFAGGIFFVLHAEPFDITVTAVSLFGLGLTYFISAYKPNELPESESKFSDMKELLAFVIIPKVLWISLSVSMVGIALLVLGSDARSYQQVFFIGGSTIAIAIVIAIFISMGVKRSARVLGPIMVRALPVLVADIYFLMR